MLTKHLSKFKLKEFDEKTGTFEGHAAVFGNVDRHNERIKSKAFTRTLMHQPKRPVLLFHDAKQPAGMAELSVDRKGLISKGSLNLKTQFGQFAYEGMKGGELCSMSIGYSLPKGSVEWTDGVKDLKEINLFEVSLLTTGLSCNPEATVTEVKSLQEGLLALLESGRGEWTLSELASEFFREIMSRDQPQALKILESLAQDLLPLETRKALIGNFKTKETSSPEESIGAWTDAFLKQEDVPGQFSKTEEFVRSLKG